MCLFMWSVQDLNENSVKDSDEEAAFKETGWVDVTEGYSIRLTKKVNMIFCS